VLLHKEISGLSGPGRAGGGSLPSADRSPLRRDQVVLRCLLHDENGATVLCTPRSRFYLFLAGGAIGKWRPFRSWTVPTGRGGFAYCRNYTYIVLSHFFFWRRAVFLGWWFLVGERGSWGPGAMANGYTPARGPLAAGSETSAGGEDRGSAPVAKTMSEAIPYRYNS
jgi:hypothetical protein